MPPSARKGFIQEVGVALKTWHHFGTFFQGGTPWEKVEKRCQNWVCVNDLKIRRFRAQGSIWTPLKKHEILGRPKNGPKAALGRPKGPKDAQKGAF